MFAIQKMIDSGFTWLFAVCILPLCLAVPALGPAASSANLPLISDIIDPTGILIPKPTPELPPPPYQGATAMEQTA